MTVTGPVDASDLGTTLTHEHVLVDFIGAERINHDRWDRNDVLSVVLPYIEELKACGCRHS
jgi:phosphotriesterase-related protein